MPRHALALSIALLTLASGAAAQRSARSLLENAARAMGGRDRVLAVRTLVMEGTGESYNLGQNVAPEAALPVYAVTQFRRTIDFVNRRWKQDLTREPRFLTGNPAAQRQRVAFDSVAWNTLPNESNQRAPGRADIERSDELMYHPVGFLQVALRRGTEVTDAGLRGGQHLVRVNAGGNKFAVLLDPRTRLPSRIEKIVYHPMLGDVVLETRFSDWQESDGVTLPRRIVQRLDGRYPVSELALTSVRVDTDARDIAAPAEIRTAAAPTTPAPAITVDSLATGVWYLAGQSHHSVVIEMNDHLLLVETPQGDERTLAVIRRARALRPNKPLRAVINTHHHFDHAGGVRAAMAEGLTIITHSGNYALFNDLSRRQHFIVRDTLAKAPTRARIETVTTKRVLTDGQRSVEIHHVRGSPHAQTLLMVYLPAEKLLIQADAYNPPAPNTPPPPSFPFVANLVENVDRLGLQVERVVPLHGYVVPMSELRRAAGR